MKKITIAALPVAGLIALAAGCGSGTNWYQNGQNFANAMMQ